MDTLIVLGAKYLFALVVLGAAIPLVQLPKNLKIKYLLAVLLTAVIAFGLTTAAGASYFDARPFTHGVHALIDHEPDNGFPSDHTVFSFTAAFLCLWMNPKIGAVLVFFAACVGACRALSGVHSPIDIIAGIVIAAMSAAIGIGVVSRLLKERTDPV